MGARDGWICRARAAKADGKKVEDDSRGRPDEGGTSRSVGYYDVVSLHFNAQADFGSHAAQLGLLGLRRRLLLRLRRRLLLRRCCRGRLRSRLLTTSAHDSPTNDGEDNNDGGCNKNHLISRHALTSHCRCPA
jgi:hypothetical protein